MFRETRKMVVWGIRPPDPPDLAEMAETLKFQAKVFKYEMPYGLKIAPNPRLKLYYKVLSAKY